MVTDFFAVLCIVGTGADNRSRLFCHPIDDRDGNRRTGARLPAGPSVCAKEREVASQFDAAIAEIRRLEGPMTTWSPDSDISRVNAAAGQKAVVVSPEVYDVIAKAQEFSARSSGAF